MDLKMHIGLLSSELLCSQTKFKMLQLHSGFVVLVIAMFAVAVPNRSQAGEASLVARIEGQWHVKEVANWDRALTSQPYFRFRTDGTLSGFSGCNTFTGKYVLHDETIRFSTFLVTRKFCPGERGAIEFAFFAAKDLSKNITEKSGQLFLSDQNHATTMRLARQW